MFLREREGLPPPACSVIRPHLDPTEVAFQTPGSGCDKWTLLAQGLTTDLMESAIGAIMNDTAGWT